MKVTIISIPVLDQEKALQFYIEKLGFIKEKDMPLEGGNRWITLVSKDAQDGPEILLEPAPLHFEPSEVYQDALITAGIPWTQFDVEDVVELGCGTGKNKAWLYTKAEKIIGLDFSQEMLNKAKEK